MLAYRGRAVTKPILICVTMAGLASGQSPVPISAAPPRSTPAPSAQLPPAHLPPAQVSATDLRSVHRVFVEQLSGGPAADALRELIITSLDGTRLFVLTDDPEHADAVLKGAADDRAYTDSFDFDKSISGRGNLGGYTAYNTKSGKLGGYGGLSVDDRDSHHVRERKHESYAAVRLCGHNGDVLWSTTQESAGSKFRGAAADVAAKIARQLLADYQLERPPSAR